jgi:hypothetical protein
VLQNYINFNYGSISLPFGSVGLLFSFAVSLTVVLFNLVWNKVSYQLTKFEVISSAFSVFFFDYSNSFCSGKKHGVILPILMQ